MPSYREERDA
ncbi:Hypothetical protein, putative, partial [Bodo saltans]